MGMGCFSIGITGPEYYSSCIMALKAMFDEQRVPIWKSSILPLLFADNGIGISRSGENVASADLDVINEEAEKTIVALSYENNGRKFIREDGVAASGVDGSSFARQVNDQEIRLC